MNVSVIKSISYLIFTSTNMQIFYINYFCWFALKFALSLYYGINLYFILYGFLLWSFWEYIYHRIAMHGLKDSIYYYKMHGHHHVYPSKPSHIPVFQYMIVSPLFFISSYYINPSLVFSYSVGHLFGLFCFEKMHSFIHNDINKEKIYTKYHLYHHSHSQKAFCFTSPCFDILCGTFPEDIFHYNFIALLPIPYISFYGVSIKKVID